MHGLSAIPTLINGVSSFQKWNSSSRSRLRFPTKSAPSRKHFPFSLKAVSGNGAVEYKEETATNVKFQNSICLPALSQCLSLIGTGYREKVFAIIGVKVYAAGFYINESLLSSKSEIQNDFNSILMSPLEKALQIVLVRDVDGKTFWDALDEAISPRIKAPLPIDESALSKFRTTFQGRPLNKGTSIFLTWLNSSQMLIFVSSSGMPLPTDAGTKIESENVCCALFNVFFGDSPVSPSLKASVADQLERILK